MTFTKEELFKWKQCKEAQLKLINERMLTDYHFGYRHNGHRVRLVLLKHDPNERPYCQEVVIATRLKEIEYCIDMLMKKAGLL